MHVYSCNFLELKVPYFHTTFLSQARTTHTSLFSADWDFQKMGIGGLDEQFVQILRRAFASRVFPPEVVEQLGVKHVKGILLYGPPGKKERKLKQYR